MIKKPCYCYNIGVASHDTTIWRSVHSGYFVIAVIAGHTDRETQKEQVHNWMDWLYYAICTPLQPTNDAKVFLEIQLAKFHYSLIAINQSCKLLKCYTSVFLTNRFKSHWSFVWNIFIQVTKLSLQVSTHRSDDFYRQLIFLQQDCKTWK